MIGVMCVGTGLSTIIPVVFRAAGQLPDVEAGAALATLATLSYVGFLIGPPPSASSPSTPACAWA